MKQITNWRRATVADIEADGLLDEATKIHVLSFNLFGNTAGDISGEDKDRLVKFFNYHLDKNIPLVMHNGISYDIPLVEKLLGLNLSKLMVIDTLSISWYLNTDRATHGLDSFFEDYGIAKPKIDDWENLTYEEYLYRCQEDVKINVALWEDFKNRLFDLYYKVKDCVDNGLVDGTRMSSSEVCYIDQYKNVSSIDEYVDRILTFLMFKADCARLKEKTRWKVDVNYLDNFIETLTDKILEAKTELEAVMPQVPQYTKKTRPKKPYNKDGTLSATGLRWQEEISLIGKKDELGNLLVEEVDEDTIKILKDYEPPNVNGYQQIKDFLFSKGWKPKTFKFVKDEEAQELWAASGFKPSLKPKPRAIPQISVEGEDGKELCESVLELADKVPEIMAYAKYTTIKHRLDMCTGFKENLREGGYLCARVGGYTNTLREKHRELVNLPSINKPYGKDIRGLLIAERGKLLMGSDLSSLEDRVKMHFMIPLDPEYVEAMSVKGYDPHLALAVMAGLMTEEEMVRYKELKKIGDNLSADEKKEFEKLTKIRQAGKQGNYACQYGSGAETLSRTASIDLSVAKKVVEGYGNLNWAIKKISEEQCVVTDSRDKTWLVNPINGFAYSLRGDKDRFSTLCQGTGSFFFDVWVDEVLTELENRWGKKSLTFTAHDELVLCINPKFSDCIKGIIEEAIERVNNKFLVRKKLGCDVHTGDGYADIH